MSTQDGGGFVMDTGVSFKSGGFLCVTGVLINFFDNPHKQGQKRNGGYPFPNEFSRSNLY